MKINYFLFIKRAEGKPYSDKCSQSVMLQHRHRNCRLSDKINKQLRLNHKHRFRQSFVGEKEKPFGLKQMSGPFECRKRDNNRRINAEMGKPD